MKMSSFIHLHFPNQYDFYSSRRNYEKCPWSSLTIASNSGPHIKKHLPYLNWTWAQMRFVIVGVKLNMFKKIYIYILQCGHFELSLHETKAWTFFKISPCVFNRKRDKTFFGWTVPLSRGEIIQYNAIKTNKCFQPRNFACTNFHVYHST